MAKKRKGTSAKAKEPAPPLHDLLRDPVFTVREGGDRSRRSLPEVLALLGAKRVDAFPALQAHQHHAWHAFLVQLAAMGLHRAGETKAKQPAEAWEELLLSMTDGEREPWCLVVEDLSKPAFMQPPVPEGTLEGFKEGGTRPDLTDILVLARNHDVKRGRIWTPRPEHWGFVLVSLQTMEGVLGAGGGKYGIARMNKGYGSRPGVGLAPDAGPGGRFLRDVRCLLSSRAEVTRQIERLEEAGGRGLLWLEPWNGKKSAPFEGLDPYFIEVCRRVRLVVAGDLLSARTIGTNAPRLAAEELRGVTGDPWTPVNKAEATAFTASSEGFSYRVMQRLLGPEVEPGIAQKPGKGEGDAFLVAEVTARGMGQTNGYHRRVLPMPARAVRLMATEEGRKALGEAAGQRVQAAADVQWRVLRPALLAFFDGAPDKPRKRDPKDKRPRRWLDAFDQAVDAEFFERLWADLERPAAVARKEWELHLLGLARTQLERALDTGPVPNALRYRAIAGGLRVFEACERKLMKHLFDQQGGEA